MNVLQEISLGQIAVCVTFILGFIGGIGQFKKIIEGAIKKVTKPELDAINEKLNALDTKTDRQDLENVKNYLVLVMSDIERGENLDEVEMLRFEEQYEYYTKNGGNSYIRRKYDKLKSEGKI